MKSFPFRSAFSVCIALVLTAQAGSEPPHAGKKEPVHLYDSSVLFNEQLPESGIRYIVAGWESPTVVRLEIILIKDEGEELHHLQVDVVKKQAVGKKDSEIKLDFHPMNTISVKKPGLVKKAAAAK